MLGVALWYVARPKPWDTASIVAAHPPGFNVSEDGKSVSFHYQLENRTSTDYTITTADQIKFTMRLRNGTLLPPFPALDKVLLLPFLIPAKQKAELFFSCPRPICLCVPQQKRTRPTMRGFAGIAMSITEMQAGSC